LRSRSLLSPSLRLRKGPKSRCRSRVCTKHPRRSRTHRRHPRRHLRRRRMHRFLRPKAHHQKQPSPLNAGPFAPLCDPDMLVTVTVAGDPLEFGCPGEPAGVESPKMDSEVPADPPVAVLLEAVAEATQPPPPAAPVCWPKDPYPDPPLDPASVKPSACAVVSSSAAPTVEGKAPAGLPPVPPFPADPPWPPSPAPPPPAETTSTQSDVAERPDDGPVQSGVLEVHVPPPFATDGSRHTADAPPPDPELE
jgi:hypothetical protein